MSRIVEEPPMEPARAHFSQLCVLMTGVAAGVVEPGPGDALQSPNYLMGRRDGYHVVVAHLASSATLRDAAEKCAAFGRGVAERSDSHPYGPEWCQGFAQATLDASSDLAMFAATCTLPPIDRARLRAARAAARHLSPYPSVWPGPRTPISSPTVEPPRTPPPRREW
jgi:hypothetical protein